MKKLLTLALSVATVLLLATMPLLGQAQNKQTDKQQKTKTTTSNATKPAKAVVRMDGTTTFDAAEVKDNVMHDLSGTTWRFRNSASDQSTIRFSSKRGGYFRFNGQDRKFIFTYTYLEGAGTITRDRSEFSNQIDAARLMTSDFIVEKDTLTYDGRDFLRVKE